MEKPLIYQDCAIEFVTVSAEYCKFLESLETIDRPLFMDRALCLLSLLYLKARLCPAMTEPGEEEPQHFVSESDYDAISSGVLALLGTDDSYLDVMVEDFRYSDQPVVCSIAENMADIYQELADLCANYRSAEQEQMGDALHDALFTFREHWGQKVLNTQRALHILSNESE